MPVERSSHPVAIVTGGSRGIGAAAATALVACGYRVIITGRDHDRLKVTADRIGAEFAVAVAGVGGDRHDERLYRLGLRGLSGPID
jgi:3-oxoacyl-[acyl-carrier protein] reductase